MRSLAIGLGLAVLSVTPVARAQTAPVAPAAPPPPAPAQAPAVAPPVAAQPSGPPSSPWRVGDPVPSGYHVEDMPRRGLVIAGAIVLGVPYFFSVVAASSASAHNESGWLYLPVAGPWVTLGRRDYGCNPDQTNSTTSQNLACVADVFVVMGLVFDGIVQAVGGTLLLAGELATKPGLVRNDEALHVVPMRIGSGMGAGVIGGF